MNQKEKWREWGIEEEKLTDQKILKASVFETPLGDMIAIAEENVLYLLDFDERRNLKEGIKKLASVMKAVIAPGASPILTQIQQEVTAYFEGDLTAFQTPFQLFGTPFQQAVWEELSRIPYGRTRSYQQQSCALGREKAYRAVANANGMNQLAILIPCHRIIRHNGDLGGYGGGISRKKWLLEHESAHNPS